VGVAKKAADNSRLGVQCYACHRLEKPLTQTNGNVGTRRSTQSGTILNFASAASARPQLRPSPSIASAAMNTCCGGRRDSLCLRWSRCGVASASRSDQPLHSRSGGANPAHGSKMSGDHDTSTSSALTILLAMASLPQNVLYAVKRDGKAGLKIRELRRHTYRFQTYRSPTRAVRDCPRRLP
jgi:hypothetical protein